MNQAVISLKGVTKEFTLGKVKVEALKGVDLEIRAGEFVVIFGPSGSGKSTLLGLIGGLEKTTSGEILVRGQDINKLKPNDLARYRRSQIGMVFQQFNLIPTLSALDNIALPLLLSGVKRKEALKRALEILNTFGLKERARHKPTELSGGEQQRVAIGRALTTNPWILLVDEPTGNLDQEASKEIAQMLEKIHQWGRTIILVTHNPDFLKLADRVCTLVDGKIVKEAVNRKPVEGERERKSPLRYYIASKMKAGMSTWETFRLARAHFLSKKLRVFFTTLGVALGIGSIVALVSLGIGLQKITANQLATFDALVSINVSAGKNTLQPLNDETVEKIKKLENVVLVSPSLTVPAKATLEGTTTQVVLQGVKEEALDFEGIKIEEGKGFKEKGAIITKATAKNFDISDFKGILEKNLILEVISLPPEGEPAISSLSGLKQTKIETTISGIANDELVSAIYLPLDKLKGVLGKDAYDSLKVKVSDRKKVALVRNEIEKMGYSTSAVLDLIAQIDRVFLITQIVLGTIGGVALVVALLGIINTMMISLLERTHEIGIMKAIGASNREIRRIFAYESGLFGLLGGIFGVGAAFLLGQGVNSFLNYLIGVSGGAQSMVIFVTPKSFALEMIILSVLVSLLAGWWPARRAAKLSAMEALRYE